MYRSYGAFDWRLIVYYKDFAPTEQVRNHIVYVIIRKFCIIQPGQTGNKIRKRRTKKIISETSINKGL